MSHYDYRMSQEIRSSDPPFAAIIMSAMMKADSSNLHLLRTNCPELWKELSERYNLPGGYYPEEVSNE